MIKLEDAKELIKLAREAISSFFEGKEPKVSEHVKRRFSRRSGVFVSLYVGGELNGCIGFARPVHPLWKAIILAARGAAFEDPRFPPLKKEFMPRLEIELSILSEPAEIKVKKPEEYLKKIKIGRDGLLIENEFGSGLLLPQVPVEWGWDVEEFLKQACMKAGIEPDAWKDLRKKVYKFQAQIFREKGGRVIEKH